MLQHHSKEMDLFATCMEKAWFLRTSSRGSFDPENVCDLQNVMDIFKNII